MRPDNLDAAIEEAQRFLKKARAAKQKIKTDEWATYGCKETAAVKRSSMDLTRALADLRRP